MISGNLLHLARAIVQVRRRAARLRLGADVFLPRREAEPKVFALRPAVRHRRRRVRVGPKGVRVAASVGVHVADSVSR